VERNMAVVTVQVGAQIQWLATYNPTSRRWVGICDPMNLTMEADTLDELHSVIEEAIQLMLRDLLEDNELDAYLRDMGWNAQPIPVGQLPKNVEFDVPWQLVAEKARGLSRSAA
jgi:predicted RNase H-like HicB family nuclease